MDVIATIFCLVLLAVTTIFTLFKIQYHYWRKRGIPRFPPRIPYGTLFRTGNKKEHILENFIESYNTFKGKTPFIGMFFFTQPCAFALDLDLIHHVLIKDFNKFHDRGVYHNPKYDPMSVNLFNVSGRKWKELRSKLTPTFTSSKMKFMFPTIIEVAHRFDQTLQECLRMESTMEIKELLARFTTDVIGTCAFGIECNSLKDPNAEFRIMGRKFFSEPQLGPLGRSFANQCPRLSVELGIKTIRKEISQFFMGIVRETVEYREKYDIRRDDFMDILIELKNSKQLGDLSLEDVAAQAFLFFLAGFETSSTTMAFAIYELAINEALQDKARQEINYILRNHNGELTYEAMMDMRYLDYIISETLRKHPPVIVLMRVTAEDYNISGTDKTIPKGTKLFIPVYCIHHDPVIYPSPQTFNPDRFVPEEAQKRHPMSFLGFGEGPRNCIGARFGRMQTRIGLATLLKNYHFKTCPQTLIPMKYSPDVFVLAPEGGMYLNVERVQE